MTDIEILAPAGGTESIYPAVRMGADAVYIGAADFSARSGAENFDSQRLVQAVEYCHAHDVKVYVALNTTLHDDELDKAARLIKEISQANADAVIVQDIGVAKLIAQTAPQLRLHASTQMTVHTPAGARALYSAGFSRVVLARELSMSEISEITHSCPIETEVFVHGALCMCVSGQCYFSAMIGSRSGNRGRCAQPCRLPFAVNGIGGNALSLKDLSLTEHIRELADIGVTSLKIEGRMKRPEYVAAAVKACREALDDGKPKEQSIERLEAVFSRQGFTDGYFTGKTGKAMFGVRTKENVVAASENILAKIRNEYKDEKPKIPLTMSVSLHAGSPSALTVSDGSGNTAAVFGDAPQAAVNAPITYEKCLKSLSKTGGTPFFCEKLIYDADDGLAISASQLNKLRRDATEKITQMHIYRSPVCINEPDIPAIRMHKSVSPTLRAIFKCADVPEEFSCCEYVFVPYNTDVKKLELLREKNINVALEIPRVIFGQESNVRKHLLEAEKSGVKHVLAHTQDAICIARECGMKIHGGYGLNITNTMALIRLRELGVEDVQVSQELTLEQIKNLGGDIPRGIGVYGYMPLMICRNCPAASAGISCSECKRQSYLTDRKGKRQKLVCNGIATEILNAVPTVMTDRLDEIKNVDFHVMEFYVENHVESVKKLSEYQSGKNVEKNYTRGLYYRGVL